MTPRDLLRRRLHNQRLLGTPFRSPEEAVAWLGAVQAQDYAGAKWALALRTANASESSLDAAFDEGRILRTHAMRPTWHFVAPADIRWLLALTAGRVRRVLASYDRRQGVTPELLKRSRRVFEKALEGGRAKTRAELAAALGPAGAPLAGQALAQVMMHAELDALICSGPRRDKQFTYALVAERAPDARTLAADEALAELTARYFRSHGPATIRDFSWWSGLTMSDARRGVAMARLTTETVGALTMWHDAATASAGRWQPTAFLLPNYDEYLIAHKDREPILYRSSAKTDRPAAPDTFPHVLVVDGTVAGLWSRGLSPTTLTIGLRRYRRLTAAETRGLRRAAERYAGFVGKRLEVRG